jgi:hypothetical protein
LTEIIIGIHFERVNRLIDDACVSISLQRAAMVGYGGLALRAKLLNLRPKNRGGS